MAITYRPMRPKDVRECVEIVAASPIQASLYGAAIRHLKTVWQGLLGREAFRAIVLEETRNHSKPTKVGVGVSAFISDDFLHFIKTPPFFWVYPELIKRIATGKSPLPSDKQIRAANADGGLNLFLWGGALRSEYANRPEVLTALYSAFLEQHRGFLLKELILHGNSIDRLQAILRAGGQLLDESGEYVDQLQKPLHEIFEAPHYAGLTREAALSRLGSSIAALFIYEPPQFGFRPSEQRMLLAAVRGGTDEELANELGISLSAMKKMWLSIYERASTRLPTLLPNRASLKERSERGKEKKQRLLAYLREHPEELRPASP